MPSWEKVEACLINRLGPSRSVSLCCNTIYNSSHVALWELWLREPRWRMPSPGFLGCDRLSFVSDLGVGGLERVLQLHLGKIPSLTLFLTLIRIIVFYSFCRICRLQHQDTQKWNLNVKSKSLFFLTHRQAAGLASPLCYNLEEARLFFVPSFCLSISCFHPTSYLCSILLQMVILVFPIVLAELYGGFFFFLEKGNMFKV